MEEINDLYLDLLKRSLTNTIFSSEPDHDEESPTRFAGRFAKQYINSQAISMLPHVRLDHIRNCVRDVLRDEVAGDLLEAGVWRGGATIYMRALLKVFGVTDRQIWVADSFEGLPEPDAEKFSLEAKVYHGPTMQKLYNRLESSFDEVQRNFEAYGMLDERVCFLRGWFKDTLPTAPIEKLAILRVDCDFYESTMDVLTSLYGKVSKGGYVIIDDYGERAWTLCKEAVDDFRRQNGIDEPLHPVDTRCYFWRRYS